MSLPYRRNYFRVKELSLSPVGLAPTSRPLSALFKD